MTLTLLPGVSNGPRVFVRLDPVETSRDHAIEMYSSVTSWSFGAVIGVFR